MPAVAQSGYPGFEVTYWIGLVTRAGLPEAARAKLEKALAESLNEENRAALVKGGVRPLGASSKELDALIAREYVQWRDLAKKAGLTMN